MYKRILLFLLALCLCLPALAQEQQPKELKIKLFKSGKADAFLLRFGNSAILIDTAESDDAEDILEYLDEKDVAQLDVLILSHFDKGHAGGAPEILRTVPVKQVLMPSYQRESEARLALDAALKEVGITPTLVTEDYEFTLEGIDFQLLTAEKDFYDEDPDNNFSLVTRFAHGENSFLFGADILSQRIGEMLGSKQDWQSTFLQVPDHGRNGPATEAFLRAVSPKYAVITCSEKNPPAGAVLALLHQLGTTTYLTMDGDIALTSDGQAITFKQ